jgi:hypothetical protein
MCAHLRLVYRRCCHWYGDSPVAGSGTSYALGTKTHPVLSGDLVDTEVLGEVPIGRPSRILGAAALSGALPPLYG